MEAYPPSGRQYELTHADQRAVVTEVGAGLRTYSVAERPLLDGYGEDEMCRSGRGQVLMPWPNRIADGTYEFDGVPLQLALTEPKKHDAIHGLVRWASWSPHEQEPHRVVMQHVLHPQPGYPFTLELAIEYGLSDDGLTVRTTARNAGATPCPFGAGAHPYLTLGTQAVDDLTLRVPGAAPHEATEYDFREPRRIGATVLDHAFTDLERDDDGIARAALHDIELWVDAGYTHLMVFTGDPLPDVNRRAIAIEPMTCPPDAFRSGDGVIRLEPGESVSLAWGLRLITPIG